MVEAIEQALQHTNGTKIVDMLRNPTKFNEGLFHIYIAKCISNSGLKIHFLEEDNKNKTVDWKITDPDTGNDLLVELTELSYRSSEEKGITYHLWSNIRQIKQACEHKKIPQLSIVGGCLRHSGSVECAPKLIHFYHIACVHPISKTHRLYLDLIFFWS